MLRRSLLATAILLPATALISPTWAHPPQAPQGVEAQRMIDEVTAFRVFTGPTVIVTAVSPILNVTEQKTYDVRWVSVYVTTLSGWQLAVGQATRLA